MFTRATGSNLVDLISDFLKDLNSLFFLQLCKKKQFMNCKLYFSRKNTF